MTLRQRSRTNLLATEVDVTISALLHNLRSQRHKDESLLRTPFPVCTSACCRISADGRMHVCPTNKRCRTAGAGRVEAALRGSISVDRSTGGLAAEANDRRREGHPIDKPGASRSAIGNSSV